jgi:hypothetical protein
VNFIQRLEDRCLLSLVADANLDHKVDSQDFGALSIHFNQIGCARTQGDFNADSCVNALDFNILATSYGRAELPAFDPAQIPGLVVSLDPDAINQPDGTSVATVPGADGTLFSAQQPTPDQQPTLRINSMNGHNALQLDGFVERMHISGANSALPGAATTVIVFDDWEDTSYTLLGTSQNDASDRWAYDGKNYDGAFRASRLEGAFSGMPEKGSHVVVIRSTNGFWDLSLDGKELYSTTDNTFFADTDWTLGALRDNDGAIGGQSLHGLLARAMVYNSVLSNTDVANLSDWAIQRYGLDLGNVSAYPQWTGGTGKRYLHIFHHTPDETLWFGESDDGIHIVNAGEANLSGYYPAGDFAFGGLRDPSYHREGNFHYLAVSNISIEHRPESFRSEHFTILRSSDLVNWSTYGIVDLSSVFKTPGDNCVWAPQWFQDTDGSLYVIVSTSDDDAGSFRFRAVPITSLDPLVYGNPIELNYPGTSYIDASIQKIGSTYRLWAGPGEARYMESSSLFGPYSAPTIVSWFGSEGPFPLHVGNEDRVYFDMAGNGAAYIASTDGGQTFPIFGHLDCRYLVGQGDVIDTWAT